MKKSWLVVIILIQSQVNAQITLEHTYDSASTITSIGPNGAEMSQLLLVKLEVTGERYIKIDRWNKKINIYDLNHSWVKDILFSTFPMNYNNQSGDFLYFSENLFDVDAGIEFMYGVQEANGAYYTGIYNDDGSIIFSDTGATFVRPNFHLQQYPIYNSSQGTKMILSYRNKQAKVFSLPGTLSTAIIETNERLIRESYLLSNPNPNPTNNTTQVNYKLPEGINKGEIVFYDLQGKEVKRFNVDRTFDHLLISTADIPAGTYYYQLQTTSQASEGKKMVVIK